MQPRVSIRRLTFKRFSRPSRAPRARKKISDIDEYYLRSLVLDELNHSVSPIMKNMYSLRRTLYEEKREMGNRICLLEDDVRNISRVVASDQYGLYGKLLKTLSRSSINLTSTSSSLDNITDSAEIRSPTMIDVRNLEYHLVRTSLENLTSQEENISPSKFNGGLRKVEDSEEAPLTKKQKLSKSSAAADTSKARENSSVEDSFVSEPKPRILKVPTKPLLEPVESKLKTAEYTLENNTDGDIPNQEIEPSENKSQPKKESELKTAENLRGDNSNVDILNQEIEPSGNESQPKKGSELKPAENLRDNNSNVDILNQEIEPSGNDSQPKTEKFSAESVEDHPSLTKNLEQVERDLSVFSKDHSLKKIRFDLQKTINLSLNTISAQCGTHLLEKYKKLSDFLNDRTILVSEKPVSASVHPLGKLYSLNYLAIKTVGQGKLCVSYNPESAFAIASVVVALWTDWPQYGKLLLSHFYKAAPYLMHANGDMSKAETTEQYFKQLVPNRSETVDDGYLRKLSGITRLYCAIMVSPHKESNVSKPHPLPISVAWKWLATFLSIPPVPDISATLVLDVLEVSGNALASSYKAQFWKILDVLNVSYLPSIEEVTPAGRRGPVSRLRAFLEGVLQRKTVPPPKGLLPFGFW